jgi:hypothetical protein
MLMLNERALANTNIRKPSSWLPVLSSNERRWNLDAVDEADDPNERVVWDGDLEEFDEPVPEDEMADVEIDEEEMDLEDNQVAPPARATWSYQPAISDDWDDFCEGFIRDNDMKAEAPWSRRGLTSLLETTMREHPVMRKEQLKHVKWHIQTILQNGITSRNTNNNFVGCSAIRRRV